jgi:hypothetical protein
MSLIQVLSVILSWNSGGSPGLGNYTWFPHVGSSPRGEYTLLDCRPKHARISDVHTSNFVAEVGSKAVKLFPS